MRRSFELLALSVAVAGMAGEALAQEARQGLFRAPVFVLQPGLVTSNFIDAPPGVESSTEFNFRVVTAIPTTIPRTTLVAIVQWTPFNTSPVAGGGEFTANSPAFVYGPVFNLINTAPFSLDFDVLGAYGPAARSTDESAYTHKLVFELDAFLKIGGMMMPPTNTSRWRNLALYGLLANVATGIPSANSPWVLLTGLSLPIAP